MKLVTYEVRGALGTARRVGALLGADEASGIVDLTAAFAQYLAAETDEPTPREYAALRTPPDMIQFLRAGHEGRRAAERALDYVRAHPDAHGLDDERLLWARKDVRLLAPIPRPGAFRDCSIYEQHMTKAQRPKENAPRPLGKSDWWYRAPAYYKGSTTAIFGPEDPVPFPYYTDNLDLEIELGIVIGKEGRNLTFAEAQDAIAGYTILIDSSCRDGNEREPFGPNKRKDFHTALGPWLVTKDEVDPENMACAVAVDGETWFEGNTSAPHNFSPAQLVAYVSDNETVYPGDLIGTGTIGFGCSMDLHRWPQVGQTATFTIAGLGALSLKVVKGEHVVSHVSGMNGYLEPPKRA